MEDIYYLHCLNLFPSLGPKRLGLLGNMFESFEQAWHANPQDLAPLALTPDNLRAFFEFKNNINIEEEKLKLDQLSIKIIAFDNPKYPNLLQEIPTPPAILYWRGTLPSHDSLMFSVVGTRKITTYGRSVVPQLVAPLVDAGVTIVSGLAYGVDSLAHKQAVDKNKPTVAVLGGGIDDATLYPKPHVLFAHEIINTGGCIISEYPPKTPSFKQNFVARDRIISGLSMGTLIVECDLKSGSLITAKYALDQNRRLFAVPGPIYASESRGPNNLIKMGAQLVTESSDILNDLNIIPTKSEITFASDITPQEETILAILKTEPLIIDEIINSAKLDAATVTTALTFLEMKGRIKNLGGQQYARVH